MLLKNKDIIHFIKEEGRKKGSNINEVELTVDEENGEEIARLHGEDGSKEIYIKELKQPLEEHFNVDILTFEGYHYTEIQDAFEGFVFRIA